MGIDYWAHTFAFRYQGQTQAFLANGLDRCYPAAHQALFETIMDDSAVLSPFPAGSQPVRHHFLIRNKWMACLSDQVIVIEAPGHSGALTTAAYAMAAGKPVYVVKPTRSSARCAGNATLLRKGAAAWPADRWKNELHPFLAEPLLQVLRIAPRTFDQLKDQLDLTRYELEAKLLRLEREHWVICRGDGLWRYHGW